MIWAYQQLLNPFGDSVVWPRVWATAFAALPVVALFWLLVPRRWLAPKAAAGGAVVALLVAVFVYKMPPVMAGLAFLHGAAFGLLPVGWTIFNAMLLYNITVETCYFTVVRRSVAGISADARIQAILIGFAFGAFLEGAAGGGTPVAICGAILVGLGFSPFLAAVLCLIANTSPVAYGGLGTPLIVLSGVTDLDIEKLSVMAGHQLPLLSFLVPAYMVRCMCSWKQTWEVWPALLVGGGSFAAFQFVFATIHAYRPGLVLYPMTDIGGGIFSLVVTAIFLQSWKPRHEWHFKDGSGVRDQDSGIADQGSKPAGPDVYLGGEAVLARPGAGGSGDEAPLTAWKVAVGWGPFALMSVLLLLTGLVRQEERRGPVKFGPLQTNYMVGIPALNNASYRDPRLHPYGDVQAAIPVVPLASANPFQAAVSLHVAQRVAPRPEKAEFDFAWLTAPGTAVFLAAVLSMIFLRMTPVQIARVLRITFFQMKIPIPTIACMLGLSYVTRYAGMDATLGVAFAGTGILYPFFAPILGWLGVFLTGTDAGSNALFGSLQKITADQVYHVTNLHQAQAQILICTSNSTGGVMGKMIDAQSICVATAATNQLGKEADIFKAVIWHSIFLATLVGLITLLQAYVWPFTGMVPR